MLMRLVQGQTHLLQILQHKALHSLLLLWQVCSAPMTRHIKQICSVLIFPLPNKCPVLPYNQIQSDKDWKSTFISISAVCFGNLQLKVPCMYSSLWIVNWDLSP